MVVHSAASRSHYPFDNAAPQAGERFLRLAQLYDGVTERHLDRLGVTAGWQCLEVGAGGGSIAHFMSDRVGPTGRILATDINTDWISASRAANIDVRLHDIGIDPLADGAFDLVHARAVLTFVPGRERAITRMIGACKPGGWILIEELVAPATAPAPTDGSASALGNKSRRAIEEVIRRRGGDPGFGRKVPGLLLAVGLVDVDAEGYFVPFCTDAVAGLARANIDQLAIEMIATGVMSSAELDRYRTTLDRPDRLYPESMALISVWGRRPLS